MSENDLLRPGETCWRIEPARRLAVIVDAEEYFSVVREAIIKARHSVLMIGWDFDTRISLFHGKNQDPAPRRLGRLLDWAVKNRPDLHIHLLKWDLGTMRELGRGSTPLFMLDWLTSRRIRFKLDMAHPASSAHHQKIIVIDDALAFCGGIDATADRWDTRDHLDEDSRRRRPTTRRRYGPWHDVTTAVDGAAARALGDLARARWHAATGETLSPPPSTECGWPEALAPSLRDVKVAISRTAPEYDGRPGVYEIERLYLEAIGRCRKVLYVESQYFASRRIAEAMAARLAEPDPPEIVVVNPVSADGWLEEEVMGSSRARLLRVVQAADHRDRFRIYTPVTQRRRPIYVHAKVLVMDDRLLKVGSSNLNNRSMGFDTECDLTVLAEHTAEPGAARRRIVEIRDDLLGEHLGVPRDKVKCAVNENAGSLIAAIEALRTEDGRSLVPFEVPDLNVVEENVLGESELLDPERARSPRGLRARLRSWLPRRLQSEQA